MARVMFMMSGRVLRGFSHGAERFSRYLMSWSKGNFIFFRQTFVEEGRLNYQSVCVHVGSLANMLTELQKTLSLKSPKGLSSLELYVGI